MTQRSNKPTLASLYSDEAVSTKRNILIDMLDAIFEAGPGNPEVWKLHIDGALDRLERDVYAPALQSLKCEGEEE